MQLVALLPMLAFGIDRQAAKRRRIIKAGGKRSAVGTSAAPGRAALKVFCALPWSEAERQGASMVIKRYGITFGITSFMYFSHSTSMHHPCSLHRRQSAPERVGRMQPPCCLLRI